MGGATLCVLGSYEENLAEIESDSMENQEETYFKRDRFYDDALIYLNKLLEIEPICIKI